MSWLDKIKTQLSITTGDGKEYKPLWNGAIKEREFNIAEFEFINVAGALIKRSEPKATRYALSFYFTGPDHLDLSAAFEKSANDSRTWIINHPYYGRLIVQPLGLSIDNAKHNVSEFKSTVVETITEDYPKPATIPQDKIATDADVCNETLAQITANTITAKGIKPQTTTKFQQFLAKVNSINAKIINAVSNTEDYFNAVSQAQAAIDNISTGPLLAMHSAQAVIAAPAKFTTGVKSRIDTLGASFTDLTTSTVNGLGVLNLIDKYLYQANAGNLISSMCLGASLPLPSDYGSRDDVYLIVNNLLTIYNIYITTLDSMQTPNGGDPQSFIPDSSSIQQLAQLVNYTLSNLFNIALDAKQQRSIVLENNSNWILLAHRFYGLLADDSTVAYIMETNNAGLNEMLEVKKNRIIIYYI